MTSACIPAAVAAEELRDLGLESGLHQQLRPQPGDIFQDLRQRGSPVSAHVRADRLAVVAQGDHSMVIAAPAESTLCSPSARSGWLSRTAT